MQKILISYLLIGENLNKTSENKQNEKKSSSKHYN